MRQRFEYEFDEPRTNHITFDYSPDDDECLETAIVDGEPFLYLNRSGLLALAKLLIKMSIGPYTHGFHVHLYRDFNPDSEERFTVMLNEPGPVNDD